MKIQLSLKLRAILCGALLCLCQSSFTDELDLKPCGEPGASEASSLAEASAETFMMSQAGSHAGQVLSEKALAVPAGLLIRELGVVSGYLVLWVFRVTEPYSVALGYVLIPTATAKCDVLDSIDIDCLKQHCLHPLREPTLR